MATSSTIFILLFFQLLTITSSFTTPSLSNKPISPCYRRTSQGTVGKLSFSNVSNNDDDNYDDISAANNIDSSKGDEDATTRIDRSVTVLERARIISYRFAMSASALCLCVLAVNDLGFLDGTGASIDQLAEQSSNSLPILAGGTLILSPVPRNFVAGTSSLALAAIISGFVFNVGDIQQLGGSVSWSLSILALMTVSIREIFYFGVEYKQECIITLLTLALMFDQNNHVQFTFPLCALGMSVLAAGKLFEPCKEDLVPSNSEFLAK